MKDLLEVPDKTRSRDALDRITADTEEVKGKAAARKKVLEDILQTLRETREAGVQIDSARKVMYALFYEKLRSSEADAGDEIAHFITTAIENPESAAAVPPEAGR